MERALVNGIALEYEDSGVGEAVVFIHGGLIADTFRPLVAEPSLVLQHRLITYRRRGYAGSTGRGRPLSVEGQASDCLALLRHLGLERAHVVGHSSGGCIALQLALEAPSVVQSLALLEPALIVGATAGSYRESIARGMKRYGEVGAAVVVDEFMQARWPGYRDALEQALPGASAQAAVDAATAFEHELAGLLEWKFGEDEARRISQPVLSVLGGESNALWPRFGEVHRLLLTWLPRAEGFILPGTTHFLQVEKPADTAEALAAFYARQAVG
ncbi:MAG: alpha/beta fold hydrolase [Dehalococcoidia bacterium]|nr:alpha/beta fold hydrolase [Dehalococcoidia bacterium]